MHDLHRWLGIGALALLLSACSTSPTANISPTDEPAITETGPNPTELAEEDYCVTCHTDKETLVELAKPEEEAESESEGTG